MSEKSKIFDKIKKCLALSKSSNQHEAQAALRQAQKMMEAHNISESALLASSVGQAFTKAKAKSRPAQWEAGLAVMVGKCFGCDSFFVEMHFGGYWKFIGVNPSPEVAEYTFQVLMRQLSKERKSFLETIHGNTSRAKKTARADLFCEGWIRQVRSSVEFLVRTEEQEAAIKAFREGMNIDKPLSSNDRNKGRDLSYNDYRAYADGKEKGKDVRLHHGVDGSRHSTMIGHD